MKERRSCLANAARAQCCIILLLTISRATLAGGVDSLSDDGSRGSPDSSQPYLTLAYDPNFLERAGTENILTVHYGIARVEDKFIGTRWFSESTPLGKIGGLLLRSAKTAYLDLPLDAFSYLLAHEYFGHGSRFRELTDSEVKCHLILPIYETGPLWTYAVGSVPLSYQGVLAVREGGIEAQVLLNRDIALDWMTTGETHYRDASLYSFSFWNYFSSELRTPDDEPFNFIPDDPGGYIRELNRQAGFTDMNHLKMSVRSYHDRMALNILNPFFFYSAYCFVKTYLWDGDAVSMLPIVHIGSVRYLPSVKTAMTPFGLEYHLENYLRFANTTSLVDLRVGDRTFYTSWGGLGASFRNIASWDRLSADLNVDTWKQPKIMVSGTQVIWSLHSISYLGTPGDWSGGGFGGAVSLRAYYNFADPDIPIAAMAELGYKSVGFLEGYSLDASPIVMVGIAYRPK